MRKLFNQIFLMSFLTMPGLVYANSLEVQKTSDFYVLFAESAFYDKNNKPLEDIKLININETIRLENGFAILVHLSGKFLEFKGDTTVVIKELSEKFKKDKPYGLRPDVILIDNYKDWKEIYLSKTGGVTDRNRGGMIWASPHPSSLEMEYSDSVCLNWWYRDPDQDDNPKILFISNMFDELLDSILVQENRYMLDLKKYSREQMILIRVEEKVFDNHTDRIAIRFGAQLNHHVPNSCAEVTTPIKALEIAYYFEFVEAYKLAREYYKLAASLSNHEIYSVISSNFEGRIKRLKYVD